MSSTCPYCARHHGEDVEVCWNCGLNLEDVGELHQRIIEDKRRAGGAPFLPLLVVSAIVTCFWLPAVGFSLLFLGLHLGQVIRSERSAPIQAFRKEAPGA